MGTPETDNRCAVQPLLGRLAAAVSSSGSHVMDAVVKEFWCDFAGAVSAVGPAMFDGRAARRPLVALFASKLYLHLGVVAEAARYALAACDLIEGPACDAYAARVLARWIDRSRVDVDDDDDYAYDGKLSSEWLMDRVLRKLTADGDRHQLVAGVALRAGRVDAFTNVVGSCDDRETRRLLLEWTARATAGFDCQEDRRNALRRIAALHLSAGADVMDRVNACHCFALLDDAVSVARQLDILVRDTDDGSSLTAFQIALDLCELNAQALQDAVLDLLFRNENPFVRPANDYQREVVLKLTQMLRGEVTLTENSKFLSLCNNGYAFVSNSAGEAVCSSTCRSATVIAHGLVHSGTACETFLSDYLGTGEWTGWQIFSAVVSVGVIYKGHETDSLTLMRRYLHLCATKASSSYNYFSYSEGGSLYALGLIHVNHGAAVIDYILRQLNYTQNEVVKHGCCLGIGLSALGTNRSDIYEVLKINMHYNHPDFGGAAGIAIGMVMLGSNDSGVLQELLAYAQVTLDQQVMRSVAVGISFVMYNRLEEADELITYLLFHTNPMLRCCAMYTLAMAYCGTGSETAVKKLLCAANSDVSDDVRCVAVMSLGFLLFRTLKRFIEIIGVFTKSYNPHVRYGAALAIGIAYAGTGLQESFDLLVPIVNDSANYVRQGALIASALIFIQQKEGNCSNVNYFRSLYAQIIDDRSGDDLVKFGAILARGIIDGGGRNVTISLESKIGHNHMLTVVGLLLFVQYDCCTCFAHCLTLAFTPIRVVGLDMKQKKFISSMHSVGQQTKQKTCLDLLCLELAQQRGWISYLFNLNVKSKTDKGRRKFNHFSCKTLISKMVQDVEVIISNWKTGYYQVRSINQNTEYINGVNCLQYDGSKIIAGLNDWTLKIWDKNSLEPVMVLTGHSGSVLCLQFDDKMIVSGSSDFTLRVWCVVTGELFNALLYHRDSILNLKFNNTMMVTCSRDYSLVVWNIMSPRDISVRNFLVGHQATVSVIDFDHKYIVSGSGDQFIRVWSSNTCEFVRFLIGHKFGISSLQFKNRLVVSASYDRTVRLWDVQYGFCVRVIQGFSELIVCVKFDSKVIVGGTHDGNIKVWNLEAALDPLIVDSSLNLRTIKVHTNMIIDFQFDTFQLVSCSKDGKFLVVDFCDSSHTSTGTLQNNNSLFGDFTTPANVYL